MWLANHASEWIHGDSFALLTPAFAAKYAHKLHAILLFQGFVFYTDLLEALKAADCVPLKTIEELRDIAYSIVGEPEKVQFGDRIVGIIEARDGTVMDVVREVKPFSFRED